MDMGSVFPTMGVTGPSLQSSLPVGGCREDGGTRGRGGSSHLVSPSLVQTSPPIAVNIAIAIRHLERQLLGHLFILCPRQPNNHRNASAHSRLLLQRVLQRQGLLLCPCRTADCPNPAHVYTGRSCKGSAWLIPHDEADVVRRGTPGGGANRELAQKTPNSRPQIPTWVLVLLGCQSPTILSGNRPQSHTPLVSPHNGWFPHTGQPWTGRDASSTVGFVPGPKPRRSSKTPLFGRRDMILADRRSP